MPPRGHVTIPPERQSARRRTNVNYDEALTDYETNAGANTNAKRLPGGYQPPPVIPQATEVDEDWEAAEEAEAEAEEEDDDGTQFKSGPCLPPSVVQRWKLVDLMGMSRLCLFGVRLPLSSLTNFPALGGRCRTFVQISRDEVFRTNRLSFSQNASTTT